MSTFFQPVSMDPTQLNIDGLTLADEGLTLNLSAESETSPILVTA
jgi:hypothetical protein